MWRLLPRDGLRRMWRGCSDSTGTWPCRWSTRLNHLVGIVTVATGLGLAAEEATEDVQKMFRASERGKRTDQQ